MLAGCGGPLSTLDPAGPAASSIALLWWIMFWGSTAIFIGVMILFSLAIWRRDMLPALAARTWIVQGGLVFPGVVVAALVVAALVIGERLIARPLDDQPLRVSAEGRMWAWSFSYPDAQGGETAVLHIPAGRPVDVELTSRDVIHSFWVPRLAGKIDAIPGHRNVIRIEADRPGVYRGICAEFCGTGHTVMSFEVEAHEEADYEAALAAALGGEEDR
jgi:cytochrome c oxidase subunit II